MNTKWSSHLFLILPAMFWGLQPIAMKALMAQCSSPMIIIIRAGGMLLFYFFLMSRTCRNIVPTLTLKQWGLLAVMGIMGTTVYCIALFEGLKLAPVFHTFMFSATEPALTAVVAAIFIKERMRLFQWMGVFLSVVGVLLMLTQGNFYLLVKDGFNLGDIFYFTNALAWSTYIVVGRSLMKVMTPIQVTGWACLIGFILYLPYALTLGDLVFTMPDIKGVLQLFYVVVFSGALANMMWNLGIAKIGTKGAIYNNVTPFVGVFFSWLLLDEVVTMYDLVGFFIVVLGIYIPMRSHHRREKA